MSKIRKTASALLSISLSICATAQTTPTAAPIQQPREEVSKIDSVRLVGDQFFFLQAPADSPDVWSLMVRKVTGISPRKLLDPATLSQPGKPAVLIDIEPSWDGRYVAVGASFGRSERSFIRVVDVTTGALLKDSIPRSFDGAASWADDNKSFYYRQVQELPAGSSRAAAFDNMRAYLHHLGGDTALDKPAFGPEFAPELHLPTRGAINAFPVPGTSLVLAVQSGAPAELDSFWAKDTAAKSPAWREVINHKDEAMFEFTFNGSTIYFITKKDAPDGRLMAFDMAKEDIAHARQIVPQSDLVLSNRDEDGVAGGSDALYVYGRRNGASVVLRIPYNDPAAKEEIKLPAPGTISDVSSDYRTPGFVFTLGADKQPSTTYTYDPAKKRFIDTHLQPR